MRKIKKEVESLEKKFARLLKVYNKVDSKENRALLKEFVETKIDEMLVFRKTLKKEKEQVGEIIETAEKVSEIKMIHPSKELVTELQNKSKNGKEK
jgi:hypothetical protein